MAGTIWTVGHSTRSAEAFIALLRAHAIDAIADVRRFPGSRRWPWFASEALAAALAAAGIDYRWVPALGGRRRPVAGSPNGAWRNASFQGYADHLASAEFAGGLTEVRALADTRRTALMCAEALWWQCHRRLIADVLVHRGVEVMHIMGEGQPQAHALHESARAAGDIVVYPPVQPTLFGA